MNFQEEIRRKKGREKIVMLTAYDFQVARILDSVGVDLILVGDSLGMVFQGQVDTKSVTVEDVAYHIRAVARGVCKTPVIADMPINSYATANAALKNAQVFIDSGACGVKIEGSNTVVVKALADAGVPVMGHVGMLPQTAEAYRVKGKTPQEAQQIMRDAAELDASGVFSIVLECMPESLAKKITDSVSAPTIGIGAGKHCDGQVLVINDMLGLSGDFKPKYVKTYANLSETIVAAVSKFSAEVREGEYPDDERTYH